MSSQSDFIREQAVILLDVARRRWSMFLLPILAAAAVGFLAAKLAPTKYSAESLVLLTGGNRGMVGLNSSNVQRASIIQQVSAIEAWLKSDQVLGPLIPRLSGFGAAAGPNERIVQMNILRASLSMELVGDTVLQMRLEGRKPEGLGKNLEIILARLMEGLTGPEQNIFSAAQFVVVRRADELATATANLQNAIDASGAKNPAEVRKALQKLSSLDQGSKPMFPGARQQGGNGLAPQGGALGDGLRSKISNDPMLVDKLEDLYAEEQAAQARLEAAQSQAASARGNSYISIFDFPDNLMIIGRPTDPIVGKSMGSKLFIACILLGIMAGGALVFAAEFLSGRLQTRRDFERASGLPVVARVGKLSSVAHGAH